jgi:hypothetical protein
MFLGGVVQRLGGTISKMHAETFEAVSVPTLVG